MTIQNIFTDYVGQYSYETQLFNFRWEFFVYFVMLIVAIKKKQKTIPDLPSPNFFDPRPARLALVPSKGLRRSWDVGTRQPTFGCNGFPLEDF